MIIVMILLINTIFYPIKTNHEIVQIINCIFKQAYDEFRQNIELLKNTFLLTV